MNEQLDELIRDAGTIVENVRSSFGSLASS